MAGKCQRKIEYPLCNNNEQLKRNWYFQGNLFNCNYAEKHCQFFFFVCCSILGNQFQLLSDSISILYTNKYMMREKKMQSSEKRLKKSRCDRKTQNLPSPQQQQQKQLDKRTNKKMCVISLIFRQQPTNWYKCNPHNSCVNDRLSSENRMFYGKLNIQSNPELVWVPIRIKIVEFFYYFALPWLR